MIENCKNRMMGLLNGYKKKLSGKALLYGIKHNPELLNAKVQEVATQVANKFIDLEMKKHGLIHCHFCNERFSLRKINGVYMCESHAKMITKAV